MVPRYSALTGPDPIRTPIRLGSGKVSRYSAPTGPDPIQLGSGVVPGLSAPLGPSPIQAPATKANPGPGLATSMFINYTGKGPSLAPDSDTYITYALPGFDPISSCEFDSSEPLHGRLSWNETSTAFSQNYGLLPRQAFYDQSLNPSLLPPQAEFQPHFPFYNNHVPSLSSVSISYDNVYKTNPLEVPMSYSHALVPAFVKFR